MIELLKACLEDFKANECEGLIILSYPQAYGSTSGPFGGIGGQTITSFQTVVIVDRWEQRAIAYFAGPAKKRRYDLKDDKKREIFWKKFQEQNL